MDPEAQLYSDRQANEILRTAVRLAAREDITFEELATAAAELGISRDELLAAETAYKKSATDEGMRREFHSMQLRQFGSTCFHVGLIALVVILVGWFEFEELFPYLLAAVMVGSLIWLLVSYFRIADTNSAQNLKAFGEWKRKKNVWLRPEEAREIVHKILRQEPSMSEKWDSGSPKAKLRKRLQNRMGYDRVRADAVLESYLRENPDTEEKLL